MSLNHGSILEIAIRRKAVSISEISRRMHVNRRSIYNWFQQENLKIEIICEIGYIIGYDFSQDFPEEFEVNGAAIMENLIHAGKIPNNETNGSVHFWMNKYILLLEKYNELILHNEEFGEQTKMEIFS